MNLFVYLINLNRTLVAIPTLFMKSSIQKLLNMILYHMIMINMPQQSLSFSNFIMLMFILYMTIQWFKGKKNISTSFSFITQIYQQHDVPYYSYIWFLNNSSKSDSHVIITIFDRAANLFRTSIHCPARDFFLVV